MNFLYLCLKLNINVHGSSYKVPMTFAGYKLEVECVAIFLTIPHIKFHKHLSDDSRLVLCGYKAPN
jgi:hypothetical protein